MMKFRKTKNYQIKNELVEGFEGGNHLTLEEIIKDYYEPKTPFAYLMAKQRITNVLTALRAVFLKEGIPFGCVNEKGEYGIPEVKEEFEYMGIKRYQKVKGIIFGSQVIVNNGVKKGLIKAQTRTESILVPQLEKGKKGEKSSNK